MYVLFVFYVGCSVVSWFLSALSLVSFSYYAINMFFHGENYYKVRLGLVADLADFNKSLENSS